MNFWYRAVLAVTLIGGGLLVGVGLSHAAAPGVSVMPASVLQGEPALVRVAGAASGAGTTLTMNGISVPLLTFRGESVAIIGTDLRQTPGPYVIWARFSGGTVATATLVVTERPTVIDAAPAGIPDELGGDTAAGSVALLARLAKENTLIAGLWTNPRMLWTEPFRLPVANPVATDRYGYLRATGAADVAHKGTDYRAPVGTRVYAMNRGVVRLARTMPVYGKIVVIDHGLGLQTLYLHLSRIGVNPGQLVLPGQLIGRSGQTGYAEGPHLHVSVRVSGISVDPERFLALLGR